MVLAGSKLSVLRPPPLEREQHLDAAVARVVAQRELLGERVPVLPSAQPKRQLQQRVQQLQPQKIKMIFQSC